MTLKKRLVVCLLILIVIISTLVVVYLKHNKEPEYKGIFVNVSNEEAGINYEK